MAPPLGIEPSTDGFGGLLGPSPGGIKFGGGGRNRTYTPKQQFYRLRGSPPAQLLHIGTHHRTRTCTFFLRREELYPVELSGLRKSNAQRGG